MGQMSTAIASIMTALIGLAALAVFVSRRADTANIIGTSFEGLSTGIEAAVSPLNMGGLF